VCMGGLAHVMRLLNDHWVMDWFATVVSLVEFHLASCTGGSARACGCSLLGNSQGCKACVRSDCRTMHLGVLRAHPLWSPNRPSMVVPAPWLRSWPCLRASPVGGHGLPSDPTLLLSDDGEDTYSEVSSWWMRYHAVVSKGVVFKSNAGGSDEFGHVFVEGEIIISVRRRVSLR